MTVSHLQQAAERATQGVGVKQLEWKHEGDGVWMVDADVGYYAVRCPDLWIASRNGVLLPGCPFELCSFAQAACQADHDSRIRSALLPDPAILSELEEMRRALAQLAEAGKLVMAGLDARIRIASDADRPVPVFNGIAELHDALGQASRLLEKHHAR